MHDFRIPNAIHRLSPVLLGDEFLEQPDTRKHIPFGLDVLFDVVSSDAPSAQ